VEVLGQQYSRDQRGSAAYRLQQPDPAVLRGHLAADGYRQGAGAEQRQEPAAGQQDLLLVGRQEAILMVDHLPRDDVQPAGVVGVAARVGPVGELLRIRRVGQLQVQDVSERILAGRQALRVRRRHPDQSRVGPLRASLKEPDAVDREGGGDRHSRDRERPAVQGDPVAGVNAERGREAALDHHRAGAYPAALGQFGLIDRGRCAHWRTLS
jgi:hypothetical protein